MTTETAPVRLSYDEQRAVDDAHRATLAPIDPKDIYITIGRFTGRLKDDECTRCGRDEAEGIVVHVGSPTANDHLCKPCIESIGQPYPDYPQTSKYGEALAMMIEGLEGIDSAIAWGDEAESRTIAGLVMPSLQELLKYRSEQETGAEPGLYPSRAQALAEALTEHGVSKVGDLPYDVLKAILVDTP